ncbi:MAG: energy-coupling factor transporter transmembrane protein EcfT [Erysipelotrichaceae bacterium]|nr:energy-coupling factor transporter transmembrane protein EcfT [Erysipelotrichaceae bacterium]
MAVKVLNYIPKKSFIHDLSGTTKLIIFLSFSFLVGLSFDTRVLLFLLAMSLLGFSLSKIKLSEIRLMSTFLIIFLVMNALLLFIFNPNYGPELYGSRTVLFHIAGKYDMTLEQLFYQFNVSLKYVIGFPIAILFISTTNPSEFASSLSQIGVPYRVSYSVSLALRYIPDIQQDYHEIAQSQEARGVALGKDVKFFERLKNSAKILLPLVLTSLNRIDDISNSMQLRSFGKHKKRTWYMKKKMTVADYSVILLCVLIFVVGMIITNQGGNNLYNPFVR